MMDLVIITGASKGIGANIAKSISQNCNTLIGIGSSEKICNLYTLSNNCKIISIQQDISNYSETYDKIHTIISNIPEKPKTIGVVLCAARVGKPGGLNTSNLFDWDNQYKSNVLGNLAVVQACCKHMDSTCKLRIAFFSGGGAAYGYPEFSGYALTKVAVVRAVENIGMEFSKLDYDASIIAVAPGAVETDMLATVIANGGVVKTKTDISEPTNFVKNFLLDKFDAKSLNGRFIHVRDNLDVEFNKNPDLFKLRRVQ